MAPQVIPVIHYQDHGQALRNADLAFDAGASGVFLIEMDGISDPLPAVALTIKHRWPSRLVGINFLGVEPEEAVRWNIECGVDMTWTDAQLTHSSGDRLEQGQHIRDHLLECPTHLFFSGVAFKHQRHEPDPIAAARLAVKMGFIPTTSGTATGIAADTNKVEQLHAGLGREMPLAIASGVTPDNVVQYAPYLSHILVATGVSSSFHELDRVLLGQLITRVKSLG
ncbi:hypothetical protein [Sphingomonas sp. 3-13AW]|uniref:hypothetical protein n=1 Tax=Sphingomonas sp. 3-13AW TaxID=3050450 RepID=UPI003BB809C8